MKYLLLVTILSPIITAYIKQLLPQIPSKWIPLIAPALGGLAEAATRLSIGTDLPEGVGVAAGAAGVAVREVVDQWRKSGIDRLNGAGLALALVFAGTLLSGCTARTPVNPDGAPLTPAQLAAAEQADRENRCDWAETLQDGSRITAAWALRKSNDEDLKVGIAIALDSLGDGVAEYCDAVRAGDRPDAERAARAAVRAAVRRVADLATAAAPPEAAEPPGGTAS